MVKYESLGNSQGIVNSSGLPPRVFLGYPQPSGTQTSSKVGSSQTGFSVQQDVHILRQFHSLRMLVDPEDVVKAITDEQVVLPTDVKHWLTENAS